jgi:hypothetical protein
MTKVQEGQLPENAQKTVGSTKDAVGVIDERFVSDGDMLSYQAAQAARRANGGMVYQGGSEFSTDMLERVKGNVFPGVGGVNRETINALQAGTITRDQAYVGSNANWTGYYLEPAAKYIFPLNTPVKNMLPRVASVGTDILNWRAILDVFGGSGPSVGNFILQQQGTPQKLTYNWANLSNVFKMIAAQDVVTFESEIYGRMFEPDVRAKVAAKLIPALMLGQETWYLNAAQKLWPPAPPSNASTATTGGTVAAATNWIIVTAVNANGETLAYGGSTPTAASIVTTGATSTVTVSINRVPNAVSYNVYVGTGSTQPANSAMWKQSATTQFGGASALNDPGGLAQGYFTVTATAAFATSGTAYSTIVTAGNTAVAFKSTDANTLNAPLTFDGIQSLIYLNAGTGSTIGVGGETALVRQASANDKKLIQDDIDSLLEAMNLNAQADPEYLLCSIRDHKKLTQIVANGTNFRVTSDNSRMDSLTGGARATKYINQTTGRVMDIVMVPYLMQGTIIALSMNIPFPVAEIEKPPLRVEYNRDLWAVEYPPDQSHPTQWMYSAFGNESIVAQYIGGLGAITGIALG